MRKYAIAASWQECVRDPRPRVPQPLDRYLEYLQQRWDEGEHSAKVLHEELKAKGYLGHYQRVKMAVAPLRRGLPVNQPHNRPPSPREVARWITSRPPRRTLDTAERLQRLLAHCPELDRTHTLVRAFAATFDTGDPGALPDWLSQLETSRDLPADAAADSQLYFVEGVNHEEVLTHCRVAVHHGGAGTTAAALRAGTPTAICSVANDMPFWGATVERLGVGTTFRFSDLSVQRLTAAIDPLLTEDAHRRSAQLGARLRAEDGPNLAAQLVDESLIKA